MNVQVVAMARDEAVNALDRMASEFSETNHAERAVKVWLLATTSLLHALEPHAMARAGTALIPLLEEMLERRPRVGSPVN